MEPPICINCICHSCGNKWKSDTWTGKCPNCGSEYIDQKAAIDFSKTIFVMEK